MGPEHWKSHLLGDAPSLALIQGQQAFSLKSQFRPFGVSRLSGLCYNYSAVAFWLRQAATDNTKMNAVDMFQ